MKQLYLLVFVVLAVIALGAAALAAPYDTPERVTTASVPTPTPTTSDWTIAGTIEQMNGAFWNVQGFVFRVTDATQVVGDVPTVGSFVSASGMVAPDGTWDATSVTVGRPATPTPSKTPTSTLTPIPTRTAVPTPTPTPVPTEDSAVVSAAASPTGTVGADSTTGPDDNAVAPTNTGAASVDPDRAATPSVTPTVVPTETPEPTDTPIPVRATSPFTSAPAATPTLTSTRVPTQTSAPASTRPSGNDDNDGGGRDHDGKPPKPHPNQKPPKEHHGNGPKHRGKD